MRPKNMEKQAVGGPKTREMVSGTIETPAMKSSE